MLITEKTKAIAKHYVTSSAFSTRVLLMWLCIATLVGVIVGFIASLFGHALILAGVVRQGRPWLIIGLPFAGLAIVFLYRYFKDADDKGTNMVIASIQSSSHIPFRMAPLIFVTTVITHLFGGSAGREGAAIQLGGSIAKRMGRWLRLSENDQHLIVMCGMSAGFSALFGTPMAATIFSLEVISVGIMHYSALVPCVTAAMIAHFVAEAMNVPPEILRFAVTMEMTPVIFFKFVAIAAMFGVASILFCMIMHQAEHLLAHHYPNPYVKIFVAGCLILLLCGLLGSDLYLGSGMHIIERIMHEGESVAWETFLLKMLFTALTIGAGFKGGEIVPSLTIGAALGCVIAPLFGMDMQLVAACGMAGVFCGVTNCPITALLLAFELFGFSGMPYYLVTVAVSYMLSGYYGLYHAQKILYSKTETHYINRIAH